MKWKDIVESPKYQAYSPEEKKATRERFWNEIVAPNINPSGQKQAYADFNQGADEIEGAITEPEITTPLTPVDNGWTQELAGLDPAFREQVMQRAQRDRGFLKALEEGKFGSTTARLAQNYAPDTAAGRATREHRENPWQPETQMEKIGHEVSALAWDMPLYAAGGIIGGASGGGNPISAGMGAMGLPYALNELMEQKEAAAARGEEFDPGIKEAWEIMKAEAQGATLGGAVGGLTRIGAPVANRIAQAIPDKVKSKLPGFVKDIAYGAAEKGSINTAQSATMLGAENVMNDEPITLERGVRDFALGMFIESLSKNPQAKQKVQDAAKHKGIRPEDIIKNVDPEKAKNPLHMIEAIDEAVFKTEQQIELQKAAKMQDVIIDNQIRANYKDGKTPQEILQVNQIPKEYRPFVLDPTPSGGFTVKPSMYEKISNIINKQDISSQKYEDILPGPIRDMYAQDVTKVIDEHSAVKTNLEAIRERFKRFKAEKDVVRDEILNKNVDELTGNYRRYETLPKVREQMDAVMDYVDSVMTPEDKFRVVLDPSSLMDHVNYKESGYSNLKPAYQEAVQKEIVARYIQETNFIPPHVIETASKKADAAIKKMEKQIIDEGKAVARTLDHISKSPEYKEAVVKAAYENMTPEQRAAGMKETLKAVDQWAAEEKALHLINFKRSMGESESFGEHNRNNKEFFGATHYADALDFAKKSPAQLYKELSKANFLKRDLLFKGFHPDMFLNKSRVAKNYLGRHIYNAFVAPLRQAEHNSIREIGHEKQKIKQFKKQFNPKERDMMGEYLISLDKDGLATLQEMGKNAPSWEQLTKAQQEKVTEIRNQLDVYFERINMARADVGIAPIERRENYVTFMRKFSLAEELGYDPTRISVAEFNNIKPPQHTMKHYASSFLKERIGGTRALETDLAYIMDTYINSTVKTIHNTPVIGKLRLALNHEEGFKESNPNAHKFLNDYLDVVAGKKVSETTGAINAIAGRVSRNVGVFVLAYNVRSAAIQPTAIVNAVGLLGPRATAMGLKDFMSPKLREFARKESKVLEGRSMDITVEEITRGAKGKYGKVQGVAADIGTMPLRILDTQTATISWLSGYRAAKEKGMTHREAVVFADDVVNGTQASASRIDLAPVQHTPIGKAVTLFNTFVINNLNFLREDIGGYKKVHNLVEQGIPLEQAKAKYGKFDTMVIREIKGKEIKGPDGSTVREPSTAVVYDTMRMQDKKVTMERAIQLAAAWTACNTIYELMGYDDNPPLPAPVSAFYEGLTGQTWVDTLKGKEVEKEGSFAGGLHELWKEMMTVFPVSGGSFVFGGESVYGAVPGLIIDTVNSLGGQPGSKPVAYIAAKWAGIPGGQQVWKLIKGFQRAEKEEIKEKRQASPKYIKQQIRKDVIKNNPGLQELKKIKQDINKLKRGY